MSKLCWDEIVLSHDDQDEVEFFLDLNDNDELKNFILHKWNLDMNQLYFWSELVSDAPYLMLIAEYLKFRVSTEIDQSMISYLEILVRDCWYNIEMNVIYLLHWEV